MTKSAKNKNNIVIKGWVFAGALAIWAIFIIVFMFRINIVEGVELERFAEKNNFVSSVVKFNNPFITLIFELFVITCYLFLLSFCK